MRARVVLPVVMSVLLGLLVVFPAGSAEADRVAGDSRFSTAVAIAQRSFTDGADTVYLAGGDRFADALSAGTLTDGPILLVPICEAIPTEVTAEIDRLDPDTIIALGGTNAICDEVLDTAAAGRTVDRLAGDSRYATSVAIAQRGFANGADTVYVANGDDSPDAVAGGALTDGPILLVPTGVTTPEVVTEVQRLGPSRVVGLGGAVAVSDDQLAAVAGGIATDRLAGDSRFGTAAAIAQAAFPAAESPVTVYLARADVFADAVAAGSLTDGPVLLVPACDGIPTVAADYLAAADPATVVALGGTNAVCDATLNAAASGVATPPTPCCTPPPTPPPTQPPTTPPTQPPTGEFTGTLYYDSFGSEGFASYDFATKRETTKTDANSMTPDGSQILAIADNNDESVVNWRDPVTDQQIDSTPLPVYLDPILSNVEGSPNGELLSFEYFNDGTDNLVVVDRAGNDALGNDPDSLTTITDIGDGDGSSHVWSAQGELYFTFKPADEENPVLARLGPTLQDLEVIREFDSFGFDTLPLNLAVSPDGTQMVYKYLEHLWRLDIATGEHVQLTTSNETETKPGFSPDGSQIVFALEAVTAPGTIYVIPNGEYPEPVTIVRHVDNSEVPPDAPYTLVVDDEDSPIAASGNHIYWFPTP